jgi:hypothetical protein
MVANGRKSGILRQAGKCCKMDIPVSAFQPLERKGAERRKVCAGTQVPGKREAFTEEK